MSFYGGIDRPGTRIRIVNREPEARLIPITETDPPETGGIMVTYDSSNSLVTLSIPGCSVTHDHNGTVTLSGLSMVAYDDEGNVTIGA